MIKTKLPERGYTIVEILVVCVVVVVIMGMLLDMFIEALRRTNDGRMRVDMQQRAIFAINAWEADIERTSQRAMVVKSGDPYCVAMTRASEIPVNASDGTIVWEEKIISWAYKKTERVLQREEYPPKQPAFSQELSSSNPYLPSFVELDSLTSQVSGQEKIMCDNVEDFSLTDRTGSTTLTQQPLMFKLKLRRTLSTSQRVAEFTIDRRYTLRNSF